MLILLEGADLTGKTTLAHRLENEHGLTYHHLGPPESEALAHHTTWIKAWQDAPVGLVMDRGHWSGLVYGPKFNVGNELGESGFRLIDQIVNRLGGLVVHCTDKPENILSRWERGEEYIEKDDVKYLVDRFDEACDISEVDSVWHYVIGDDPEADDEFVRLIVDVAARRSKKAVGRK